MYHIKLYCIISYYIVYIYIYIKWYDIILYYIVLYYTISYYIILYCIMLCYIFCFILHNIIHIISYSYIPSKGWQVEMLIMIYPQKKKKKNCNILTEQPSAHLGMPHVIHRFHMLGASVWMRMRLFIHYYRCNDHYYFDSWYSLSLLVIWY